MRLRRKGRWLSGRRCLQTRRRPMAIAATRVRELPVPLLRQELPVIAGRMKGQLDYAKSVVVGRFAVRQTRVRFAIMAFAPGADDKFANAVLFIHRAVGRLRGKAFVVVFVRVYNEVRSRFVQHAPERLYELRASMHASGTEEGIVPDCQRAECGMRLEIRVEPFRLR